MIWIKYINGWMRSPRLVMISILITTLKWPMKTGIYQKSYLGFKEWGTYISDPLRMQRIVKNQSHLLVQYETRVIPIS